MSTLLRLTLLLSIFGLFTFGKGVPAGTKITNIAYLEYTIEQKRVTTQSNQLIDTVDQLIDMKLSCMESDTISVKAGDRDIPFRFLVANMGNGSDTLELSHILATNSDFTVENIRLYLDDGNNIFDTKDRPITHLTLNADEIKTIFLVSNIPKNSQGVSSNGIELQSSTLSDENKALPYEVVIANRATIDYCSCQTTPIWLELKKSATQKDNTIHYSIEAIAHGSGLLNNVVIRDPIPAGTHFVEGSLRLNKIKQGEFKDNAISVTIDQIDQRNEQKATNIVEFDVTLN